MAMLMVLAFGAGAQQVVHDDFGTLQVKYTVGNVVTDELMLDGRKFVALGIDGTVPSERVGAPSLPLFSELVEVPLCEAFDVTVSDAEYDTIAIGASLMPRQPSRSKSDRGQHALEMDESIYGTDAYYGGVAANIEAVGVARDRRLARLQFAPLSYNPVTGSLVVCRKATVTVAYRKADQAATLAMYERYHSPAFHSGAQVMNALYPKSVRTTAPIRYLIVAHSMFRGQLDNLVQWKRRKGFITDIVYTDQTEVGTTTTAIQAYIRSQYTNATTANPAPTYLLLVGDHEQLPAFAAQVTSPSSDHITDLYYTTWTSGDHLPDCYYGRFSAQTVSQLTPQVQKTLMYEQYTFADPSYLDRAVMVAGVDGGSSGDFGYTHADPALDYAITNYINGAHGFSSVRYFKNNTSIVPSGVSNVNVASSSSSNSATVRSYYNQGAGLINYTAHGSATSWGTPNFTTSHVSSMTNTQKFGLMIGNCCLTNKFETATCFGESLLRKDNYCGAVGYIGGSNSTYWNEDFYWAVGLRSGIGPSMSMAYNASNLGVYDRVMHTHGEAYGQWVTTQGELMMQGNMAVESSSSSYKHYYWEIYHLMGDPSVMPYLTQATTMTVTAPSTILAGATTLSVTAAPYAYVALTDTATHSLKAAGYANASGQVTLALPSGMAVGGYEIAAWAQQKRMAFMSVTVVPASGAYAAVTAIATGAAVNAGSAVPLSIKVKNMGNSIARNVTLTVASSGSGVTVAGGTVNIGNLAAGDSVTVSSVTANVSAAAVDQSSATITASTSWTGNSTPVVGSTVLTVNAPKVDIVLAAGARNVVPGAALTLGVTVTNSGHAPLASSRLTVATGSTQLAASAPNTYFTLAAGASVQRQVTLQAASTMADGSTVPVYLTVTGAQQTTDTVDIYIGELLVETFEGGFTMNGWRQGDYPWEITNAEARNGSASGRSCSTLSHSQTSEMRMTINVARQDSVSFWYKVSSETNYDKFHFYIDGVEKIVTSGQVAWTRAAYPLTVGNHEIKFTYSKDVSVSSYSDCAWIDDIELPQPVPSYAVSVAAQHGTPTGAGTYLRGDTATVGVYPNAGYAFVRWNDGNTLNPRQLTVNGAVSLTATLTQGGATTVHDTTYVNIHDTAYINIHDTAYVSVHDTAYVSVHDTAYISVHDTVVVTQSDTVYLTVTEYDTVYVTTMVHDTVYVTLEVHDTTFVHVPQYLHDTVTVVLHDTVYVPQYLYDTTVVVLHDTLYLHDTVPVPFEVTVHDTTYVDVYYHDTTYISDTLWVVDTLLRVDTVYLYDTVYVYDTMYVYDTVYVPVGGIGEAMPAGVRVYQSYGQLVVESENGETLPAVTVYDAVGRRLASRQGRDGAASDTRMTFAVPATGVYMVKVGDKPACRVAVVK